MIHALGLVQLQKYSSNLGPYTMISKQLYLSADSRHWEKSLLKIMDSLNGAIKGLCTLLF